MVKNRKWPLLFLGGLAVLLIGLLASVVMAQTATPEASTQPEDEAAALIEKGLRFGFGHGGLGHFGGDSSRDENLAEALGITVEELQAARDEAFAKSIADAVAAGQITQEQADRILAMQALRSYVDQRALLAEALDMTVEELDAALADQSLWDLMFEKDISPSTLQTNMQAAFEAAVARAVTDGVITQVQADAILSGNQMGLGPFGGHGGHGGRGHIRGFGRGLGPWGDPSDSTAPNSTTPETTDTAFGA